MQVKTVALYEYYGLEKPEDSTGSLDCYVQRDSLDGAARLRPAVLIIPGGGYGHVSPREGEPIALRFLARGWNAFVLQYSVAPVKFPVALQEAAMAMGYIRRNAAALEVDPAMVAAIGFSAGGHLCGMLGTMYDAPEVAHIGPAGLLRPDALGLCYPVAVSWGDTHEGSFENLCGEDASLRSRLSLEQLVRADMPPVFLWHTRDDGFVPCRNSLIMASALQEAGVDFAMHIYRHGSHGLSTADAQVYLAAQLPKVSPGLTDWPEEMMEFLREIGFAVYEM